VFSLECTFRTRKVPTEIGYVQCPRLRIKTNTGLYGSVFPVTVELFCSQTIAGENITSGKLVTGVIFSSNIYHGKSVASRGCIELITAKILQLNSGEP